MTFFEQENETYLLDSYLKLKSKSDRKEILEDTKLAGGVESYFKAIKKRKEAYISPVRIEVLPSYIEVEVDLRPAVDYSALFLNLSSSLEKSESVNKWKKEILLFSRDAFLIESNIMAFIHKRYGMESPPPILISSEGFSLNLFRNDRIQSNIRCALVIFEQNNQQILSNKQTAKIISGAVHGFFSRSKKKGAEITLNDLHFHYSFFIVDFSIGTTYRNLAQAINTLKMAITKRVLNQIDPLREKGKKIWAVQNCLATLDVDKARYIDTFLRDYNAPMPDRDRELTPEEILGEDLAMFDDEWFESE